MDAALWRISPLAMTAHSTLRYDAYAGEIAPDVKKRLDGDHVR
jgi:hypothetical protein